MERNLPTQVLQQVLNFLIEAILIIILSVSPFLLGCVGRFHITFIQVATFFILFLWTIKSLNQGRFEFIRLPVNIPIIVFLLFVLFHYLFIEFLIPDLRLGVVYTHKIKKEALKLISYLIFFYIVLNNFQERKRINRLVTILILFGFVLSVFGIIQKLSGTKKIFWFLPLEDSNSFFASFPNRNHFASYINLIIFMTFGVVFSRLPILRSFITGFNKESFVKGIAAVFQKGIWFYIFALVVMSSSLFYSLSRGGIFSFCLGLVFFAVLTLLKNITRRGYVFLFAVIIFTVAMLLWINAPQELAKRFFQTQDSKMSLVEKVIGGRKILADKGIELIKVYPIFGVGFGAFEFIYNKRFSPKLMYCDVYYYIDHLHNDFLELFCEVGFVGFAIFLVGVLLYLFSIVTILFKRRDPYAVSMGIGAMASLFSMCAHSLFEFNFHITSNAILFFVVAALTPLVLNSQISSPRHESYLRKGTFLAKGLFLKVSLFVAFLVAFLYISNIIIRPYIAYRISEKSTTLASIKEAIRLDSLNDKYHFLLAKFFVEKATLDKVHSKRYAKLALKETKEAIRLNPWYEYYSIYADWIVTTFIQ